MQYLQPMHFDLSTSTMPDSSSRYDAPVGQTRVHGDSVHCWHMVGIQYVDTSGKTPNGSTCTTLFQRSPNATSFSILQENSQL